MGTTAFGLEGRVVGVRGRSWLSPSEEAFVGPVILQLLRGNSFKWGRLVVRSAPPRSLLRGSGWRMEQRSVRTDSPRTPGSAERGCAQAVLRRRGWAWNGACFPAFLRILGKSLGEGWAVRCPGGGVGEISVALKCSQDEPFPGMNSKVPLFGIPFVKGVEKKVWGGVAL